MRHAHRGRSVSVRQSCSMARTTWRRSPDSPSGVAASEHGRGRKATDERRGVCPSKPLERSSSRGDRDAESDRERMDELQRRDPGARRPGRGHDRWLPARRLALALLRRHLPEVGGRRLCGGWGLPFRASHLRESRSLLAECGRGRAGHRPASEHVAEVRGVDDARRAAGVAELEGAPGRRRRSRGRAEAGGREGPARGGEHEAGPHAHRARPGRRVPGDDRPGRHRWGQAHLPR
jgi:hypothetical protein